MYTENTSTGEIVKATITGGNDKVKTIEYYNNGLTVRAFRASSELFANKAKAVKYFKS